jgi:hypothetical protein
LEVFFPIAKKYQNVALLIDVPVDYKHAFPNAIPIVLPEFRFLVVCIEDLIRMKQNTGREKDA